MVSLFIGGNLGISKMSIYACPQPTVIRNHPKDRYPHILNKLYSRLFNLALFIMAKYWKQPKHPSIGDWLNKLQLSAQYRHKQEWGDRDGKNARTMTPREESGMQKSEKVGLKPKAKRVGPILWAQRTEKPNGIGPAGLWICFRPVALLFLPFSTF